MAGKDLFLSGLEVIMEKFLSVSQNWNKLLLRSVQLLPAGSPAATWDNLVQFEDFPWPVCLQFKGP